MWFATEIKDTYFMAKKRAATPPVKSIEAFKHEGDTRKNIPTAELQSVVETAQQGPVRVEYARRNRDLDPQLVWRGSRQPSGMRIKANSGPKSNRSFRR